VGVIHVGYSTTDLASGSTERSAILWTSQEPQLLNNTTIKKELEVPSKNLYTYCMVIKIGDIVKWSGSLTGEEFLVVGNEQDGNPGERVQLRELTDAIYDVSVNEIKQVIEGHSYGEGHVHSNYDA
jgi:hypothetical protein